jgi:hypothetical protein
MRFFDRTPGFKTDLALILEVLEDTRSLLYIIACRDEPIATEMLNNLENIRMSGGERGKRAISP